MPVIEPEDWLPCLQSLLWSQKIHYCAYNTCYWSRRLITVFTKPPIEPEDSWLCLQCLLLIQKIHYLVYKASYRARRSIILFTMPVIDPEDSSPCLQSLFWSQKIRYHVHRSCYGCRRFITVFTKRTSVSSCSWHVDRPIWSNRIRKIFPKPSVYMLNELTSPACGHPAVAHRTAILECWNSTFFLCGFAVLAVLSTKRII